jgi:neutral ceramidase
MTRPFIVRVGGPLAIGLALASCQTERLVQVPVPMSPPADDAADRGFEAGIGSADITPPPEVGLAGNGIEGRRATGYRLRLYARALVLRDSEGGRLAVVGVDLPLMSPLLQRLVAERTMSRTRIGADRLLMAATHTHGGPGNFLAEQSYNGNASSVAGYDPALLEFLVARISAAVLEAADHMRPAQLRLGTAPLWGRTRNRSLAAYRNNLPQSVEWPAPPGYTPEESAVDPTWTLLLVSQQLEDGAYVETGALSIFAMHGTGNDPYNSLLDADIQGIVERGLEASLARRLELRHVRPIHIMLNGAEGDVSPSWPPEARCRPPILGPVVAPAGPRVIPWSWDWQDSPKAEQCVAAARAFVSREGRALTQSADSLLAATRRLAPMTAPRVRRAFETVFLPAVPGLCAEPRVGTSTVAGTEDGPTRYRGWHSLGFVSTGVEEGGSAARRPHGCQAEKRTALGPFQALVVGRHGLPRYAQFMIAEVGDLLLAAAPIEVTTVSSIGLRDSIRAGLQSPSGTERIAVVSHANGYLQYLATDSEYARQHYEGGSTLYGPRSAGVFAGIFRRLAASLRDSAPVAHVASFSVSPGPFKRVVRQWRSVADPRGAQLSSRCERRSLIVTWTEAEDGRIRPSDGPMLRIFRTDAGDSTVVASDDEPAVRVTMDRRRTVRRWSATWEPEDGMNPGSYLVVLPRVDGRAPSSITVVCSSGD